jgi:hypothetical protein
VLATEKPLWQIWIMRKGTEMPKIAMKEKSYIGRPTMFKSLLCLRVTKKGLA